MIKNLKSYNCYLNIEENNKTRQDILLGKGIAVYTV